MQIINPATEEVIRHIDEDIRESLDKKLNSLKVAQQAWAKELLAARIQVIRNYSALLERNIEQLANVLTAEVGKPLQQSRNEVNGSRARIRWLADHAEK